MRKTDFLSSLPDPNAGLLLHQFKARNGFTLLGHMIAVCQIGSVSHGTNLDTSDNDWHAVVIPPMQMLIGLSTWEGGDLKTPDVDLKVHSLVRFVKLALKGNPDILGLLWLQPEHYLYQGEEFGQLIAHREAFTSKQAAKPLIGYAESELQQMIKRSSSRDLGAKRKSLIEQFGYDVKQAAHVIRLCRMCVEFMDTGVLRVYREKDREELIHIKTGGLSYDDAVKLCGHEMDLARAAEERSYLPPRPQQAEIEQLVMELQLAAIMVG